VYSYTSAFGGLSSKADQVVPVERTKAKMLMALVGTVLLVCTTEEEVVVEGTKEETSVLYRILARLSSSYNRLQFQWYQSSLSCYTSYLRRLIEFDNAPRSLNY
jgi:hypothetical protein